jgi:tetratricopeptide (TPR) repeat protein
VAEPSPNRLAADFAMATQRGEWDKALAVSEALEGALPGNAGVVYNKALVLKELGRSAERITCLERALEIDPAHANARFELASALMDEGALDKAAVLFAAYLASVPDDVAAMLNLGNCLSRLGRYSEALAYLRDAYAKQPSPDAATSLAVALRDSGALTECEAVLAGLPQTPENAALRLKILTQGPRGRFALCADQFRPAR